MPPTVTPITTISSGSISDVSESTVAETSCVVEVADLVEHLVERSGLFADRHHLHDHRREHRVGHQRR